MSTQFSMLAFWFESVERLFEAFFETKLEWYGAAVSAAAERSSSQDDAPGSLLEAAALSGPLRTLGADSVFLDPCHELVERIYIELPTGFDDNAATDVRTDSVASPAEGDAVNSASHDSLYGELTSVGVRQMLGWFLGDGACSSQAIHFVDMGSGTGKVVVEVALLVAERCGEEPLPDSSSFVGIEISHRRAEVATKALHHLQNFADGTSSLTLRNNSEPRPAGALRAARAICFLEGSFFDEGFWGPPPLGKPGPLHFFCCGVGFGSDTILAICDFLARFDSRADATGKPTFGAALLLFRCRPKHRLFDELCNVSLVEVETTWMDRAPAYLLRPRS